MKKKFKIKGFSILMAILMVATIIPIGAISSFAITSGDYDYLVVSETDKTIGITKYNGTDIDVTIPSTIDGYEVTIIYDQAFFNCTGLKSVIIPNSITKIADWAFASCTGITDITIPESVTSIGYCVFSGCTGLTDINVSQSNMKYSSVDGILYNKDKTSILICPIAKSGEVTILDGVISIGEVAFESCTGLKGVTIPSSVTTIGEYAFASCTGITDITIPSSVKIIGSCAFHSCTGIKDIIIPDSVTNIGGSAFSSCTALKDVTVGDSVTSVGYCAFLNTPFYDLLPDGEVYLGKVLCEYKGIMPKDTEIIVKPGTVSITENALNHFTDLKGITIPDSVTSMGYGIFLGCTGLKVVTIGNGIASINGRDFDSCTALTAINVSEGNKACSSVDGVLYNKDKTLLLCFPEGKSGEFTIPNSVTGINNRGFSDCTGLTSVTIPNGVIDIDKYAFSGCSSLTNITIPDSVTSIGDGAFSNTPFYNSLPDGEVYLGKVLYKYKGTMPADTEIIIKPGTISISDSAFFGFKDLKSVTIPDSVISMGDWVFFDCTGLASISIGNSLTNIGASAFSDCTSLKGIKIPDSVTTIGWGAFSGCTGLTGVTMGDSVTSISGNAFLDTPFFASLPDGEVYLGKVLYAYKGTMPQSTEINIKSGTISIADGAFMGCTGLKSVTIPDSVTNIGDGAFTDTSFFNSMPDGEVYLGKVLYAYKGIMLADTEINIKTGTVSITNRAFSDCTGLKGVTIPDSVKSIGYGAFYGCTSLKSVIIPSSVTSIGERAFENCENNFTILAYKGSAAEKYAQDNRIKFESITPPVPTRMLGDVNGDDKVTAADAILALRAEAKLKELSPEEFTAADVTGDGKVTAADAIKILRFEAKLISAF